MFGQALDGLVMNSTFVDVSKPTPPDEEYTWNGTYSLRDGTDPRNGQKVPPGNYKVFVSIDGKTPSEGDTTINVMGIDLSIEGVEDDKEETVGGFVGVGSLLRLFVNRVGINGTLALTASNGEKIKLWTNPQKTGEPFSFINPPGVDPASIPGELWIEGLSPGNTARDVELALGYYQGGTKVQDDKVKITVMKVEIIEPNEAPVTDNNFTFNSAVPGICDVIASVCPKTTAAYIWQDFFVFSTL